MLLFPRAPTKIRDLLFKLWYEHVVRPKDLTFLISQIDKRWEDCHLHCAEGELRHREVKRVTQE